MKILVYLTTVLILLSLMLVSLPFLAHSVQDFSPGLYMNIYMDPSLVLFIGVCCLVALPITSALQKRNVTVKRRNITLSIQMLLLVSLVLVLYFNMSDLSELINRPTYE